MVAKSQRPAKGKGVRTASHSSTGATPKPAGKPVKLIVGESEWTVSPEPKAGYDCGHVDHVKRIIYPATHNPSPHHLMFLAATAGAQEVRHNEGNLYLQHALRVDSALNAAHVDMETLWGLLPESDDGVGDSAMAAIAKARAELSSVVQRLNSLPGTYTAKAYRAAQASNRAAGITPPVSEPTSSGIAPGAIVQTDEGTVAEVIVCDGGALILEAMGEDDFAHHGERFAWNLSQVETVLRPAKGASHA